MLIKLFLFCGLVFSVIGQNEVPKTRPVGQTTRSVPTSGLPCGVTPSQVPQPGFVCPGQLLFEDNFNSPLAKGKIWTQEVKFPGEPDYPFNVYMAEENTKVEDGRLIIAPLLLEKNFGPDFVMQSLDLTQRCTGELGTLECKRTAQGAQILPPVITGKVNTKDKFIFKFGRIEVRARLPLGDWLIPEIQLEPRDEIYGSSKYASGLMRIAFIKGNVEYSKKLSAGPIMGDVDPFRSYYLKSKIGYDSWNKDFHNYTLVWSPEGISTYVDGDKYGEVLPGEGFHDEAVKNNVTAASQWPKGSVMAPFDEYFYISLGLRVGGVNDFADGGTKPWKNRATKAMLNFWQAKDTWYPTWYDDTSSLEVDFVRVYAL